MMHSILNKHGSHRDPSIKPAGDNKLGQQPPPQQQQQAATTTTTNKLPRAANWRTTDRMNAAKQLAANSSSADIAPPVLMRLERTRNPLADHADVLQLTLDLASREGFLFVAGVSKRWREAWGARPTKTSMNSAVQSASKLAWARDCGCRWDALTCARAAGEFDMCVGACLFLHVHGDS